jgi:aspartate aminotransferase
MEDLFMRSLSEKHAAIQPSVTLAITAKAKKMKADGIDVLSFAAGEPDFKTPNHIRKAAIDVIEAGNTGYTAASGIPELKKAICDKLEKDNQVKYKPENIVVSSGAKHSLFNTLQVLLNEGDSVLYAAPFWVSYPELVKMAGGVPVQVMTTEAGGFKLTPELLEAARTETTKAIIVNSPNNPTGTVYTQDELKAIAEWALEHKLYIISDEIYEKLVYGAKHTSMASFSEAVKKRTIIVNGMSKAYAMTGWRIGYTASNLEIAKMMGNIQSHATSNPNTIAQYAALEAIQGDQEPLEAMVNEFAARRDFMVDRVNSIENLSCRKPEGAFYVMVNIEKLIGKTIGGKEIKDSMSFAEYLLDASQVAVIPGAGFGVDQYVRLSYATSMDNIIRGLDRIEAAIK